MNTQGAWKLFVDTGGTFTDCLAISPAGQQRRIKVLSSSALRGVVDAVEKQSAFALLITASWPVDSDIFRGYGFRLLLHPDKTGKVLSFDPRENRLLVQWNHSIPIAPDSEFEITGGEEAPILAARVATQTALDQPLPPIHMRLGTTLGTNALLEKRGDPLALLITKGFRDLPEIGYQVRPDLFSLVINKPAPLHQHVFEVEERLDARGDVLQALTSTEVDRLCTAVRQTGCRTVAVALMHSYLNPAHELCLRAGLQAVGIRYISLSSELSPSIKLLPRTSTALANAYLSPIMDRYLDHIEDRIKTGSLKIISSAGGLYDRDAYRPKDGLLSGPAAGVIGAAAIAGRAGFSKILGFDMGGTSTDVSRYDGQFDLRFNTRVGDTEIASPALAIETVAAGGGSICKIVRGKLEVGPESAGAFPGPACYGAGGPLTLTDVNLLLGRLDPDSFGIPVFPRAAQKALDEMSGNPDIAVEDILGGFLQIAEETMAGAIRKISLSKGYDPGEYHLLGFGGAGGQHVCHLADLLRMEGALVPGDGGILSAYGLSQASVQRYVSRDVLELFDPASPSLPKLIRILSEEVTSKLQKEALQGDQIETRVLFYLRYQGQDHSVEIPFISADEILDSFSQRYHELFGHIFPEKAVELESIKVIANLRAEPVVAEGSESIPYRPEAQRQLSGMPVFDWERLRPGAQIIGPALLVSSYQTVVVERGWNLSLNAWSDALLIRIKQQDPKKAKTGLHTAAELELFTNRFASLVGDMGAVLERTSFSVNVKERLDFSCALLDPEGYLVANAPHIPVHLGGMGVCVRSVAEVIDPGPGDVVISNHPGFGGSHLPDITLIAAAYDDSGRRIGYLANRAHHAELGGKRPGSMPPDAANLAEEGVVIAPCYLVKKGVPQWTHIRKLLEKGPYPSRAIQENLADLRAGLASLEGGKQALAGMCRDHGTDRVLRFMRALKNYASACLKSKLAELQDGEYSAREELDDGSPLAVTLSKKGEKLNIDFSGTAAQHPGNLNATPAIVTSAIVYVLRLLVDAPIPLNEGLLEGVEIKLPHCMLNPLFSGDPESCPPVVGGNVETSQRIVDMLLKALGLAACSQGTMNNLIFGNEHFGYYETICGGVGATEGNAGASAVHQHMTNTRITDPEILEHRYPVRLESFSIRRGSGGEGQWQGGDGVCRRLTFLEGVELSVLAQHRIVAPYGMAGGMPGATGRQEIIRKTGARENLSGNSGVRLEPGDGILIETPGGGGFGRR